MSYFYNHVNSRWGRYLLSALFLLITLFTVITVRSGDYYHKGIAANNSGNRLVAITMFERSALWYAPFNPYWRKSVAELGKLADSHDNDKTIFLRQAENGIERIKGQLEPWGGMAFLADSKQNVLTINMAFIHLTFIAWFACSILLWFYGFRPDGEIIKKRAVGFFSASFLFLFTWLYLLAK